MSDYALENEAVNSFSTKDDGRLNGWEEIASYLCRRIRTVQRWEKESGLPVRRLFKQRHSLVYAYRQELARWVKRKEEQPFFPSRFQSESKPQGDPVASTSQDMLAGWKDVAAFLGRSVRTVQRWEKKMGLPLRRLKSEARSIPYALRSELAHWLKECGVGVPSAEKDGATTPPPSLLQAIIDGYGANIAVLDTKGTVVSVNKAWKEFGPSYGNNDPNFGLGRDFLGLCRSIPWGGDEVASAATTGVLEMLSGARREFRVKYPRHRAAENRWFSLHVTRFNFQGSAFLIVAHDDITELLAS